MKCRHCEANLNISLIDLGSAPPSNAYLTEKSLKAPEKWFPLKVLICKECWLVQTEDYSGREELFSADYAYFSSISSSWLKHAENYVIKMIDRFGFNTNSFVVEIAANDGYLLQYFKARNIPCLGIEPTASTAKVAKEKGIEVVESFFGAELSHILLKEDKQADLIVANNVLAHVPNINDFVLGFTTLLKPNGIATFEFPQLLKLIENIQFDTIYHEHFSYLSLTAVEKIFEKNGLQIFDVEEIDTHGGSLRVFVQRKDHGKRQINLSVNKHLSFEENSGLKTVSYYSNFQQRANLIKYNLINFLIKAKCDGKKVAAYGAAAKGNTLLNYAGVRPDLIEFAVDLSLAKQNKYLPGSRIKIVNESVLQEEKPDYVLILPWNLKHEIIVQLNYIKKWGGKFVIFIPTLEII